MAMLFHHFSWSSLDKNGVYVISIEKPFLGVAHGPDS